MATNRSEHATGFSCQISARSFSCAAAFTTCGLTIPNAPTQGPLPSLRSRHAGSILLLRRMAEGICRKRDMAFTSSPVSTNQARIPEHLAAMRVLEADEKRDSSDDVMFEEDRRIPPILLTVQKSGRRRSPPPTAEIINPSPRGASGGLTTAVHPNMKTRECGLHWG